MVLQQYARKTDLPLTQAKYSKVRFDKIDMIFFQISVTLEYQIVENPSYDHTMVQQTESRCPWLMTDSIISYPPPLFSVQSFMRKEKGLFIYICEMLRNKKIYIRWNYLERIFSITSLSFAKISRYIITTVHKYL